MPFHLSRLEEDDIPAFVALDAKAMANWGLAHAMQNCMPADTTRPEMIDKFTRKDFGKDPEITWLKVVDTETDEMAAAAMWRFELNEQSAKQAKDKSATEAVVEAAREGDDEPEQRPTVMDEMGRGMDEFREKFVGTRPRASK